MTRRIIVRIARSGAVDARTEGMHGNECLDVVPILEELLEGHVVDSRYTEDFYVRGTQAQAEDVVQQQEGRA